MSLTENMSNCTEVILSKSQQSEVKSQTGGFRAVEREVHKNTHTAPQVNALTGRQEA